MKLSLEKHTGACLVLLASLWLPGGCKQVSAGARHVEEAGLPTSVTHPAYAGRATLLLPNGIDIHITEAEVNEVTLHAEPDATNFEEKWATRVQAIRDGKAERQGLSKLDRDWLGEHTVQYDTARGTIDLRTWERWGVLGNSIIQGKTVTSLAQAQAAKQALNEVFQSLQVGDKPAPGDFYFGEGLARLPLNGEERITAEWQEPVSERPGEIKATLGFLLITNVVEQAGAMATVQQEMHQRLEETKRMGSGGGVDINEVRSGSRTVNGLQGEESVILLSDKPSGKTSFSAQWLSPGASKDAFAPSIIFSAKADELRPADAPLLLAQWTAALQSLRFPRK